MHHLVQEGKVEGEEGESGKLFEKKKKGSWRA